MSRRRLFVGGIAFCAVALAITAAVFAAGVQERRDPQPTRVEYTVASASSVAETTAVAAPRVAVPMRRGDFGPVPETLTLVMVGGLLIGLAAAVRRTT